ncbi:hypothetical protein HYH03_009479 [Edaphochlamys debaryana]|uniref:Uncharacterized protein n=1 Tax=Edaphochlamys debaryana TaxID=47281 RepID=A0A836BX74_9CHLO|nr:hypothetical protein HYH03_009479 [Edaphochlamys debaryana]|eukprot:KAG2492235.1 hypothetical protein HYH03_009479 [Edaphochlamys debaryana]
MPSRKGRRAGGSAPAAPIPTPAECVAMLADALVPHNSNVSPLSLDEIDALFLDEVYGMHLPALAAEQALDVDALSAALRLHAGLLRPFSSSDSASAGFDFSADDTESRRPLLDAVLNIVRAKCDPDMAASDALTLLRILRAMLRAQTLHALSRQLAAAAAALEPYGGGAGSGAGDAAAAAAATEQGRAALVGFYEHTAMFVSGLLHGLPFAGLSCDSPALAAAVAAERAAGVEELARGLAESGVLEHAARVLLLLQARGPQAVRPREGAEKTLAYEVLNLIVLVSVCGVITPAGTSCATLERREEWWRLAAGALAYGGEFLQYEGSGAGPFAQLLRQLVTVPLIMLWPDGRLDLEALPAEPPAEVAAALASGLPQALMALVGSSGTGTLSTGSQCVASELLAACDALFLTPLLAYGDPEWAAAFLAALGSAQGNGPAQAQAPPPTAPQAAGVVGAVAEALRRCGWAVLAGAEVSPSRVGEDEPAPLQQLRRVVARAGEQ